MHFIIYLKKDHSKESLSLELNEIEHICVEVCHTYMTTCPLVNVCPLQIKLKPCCFLLERTPCHSAQGIIHYYLFFFVLTATSPGPQCHQSTFLETYLHISKLWFSMQRSIYKSVFNKSSISSIFHEHVNMCWLST